MATNLNNLPADPLVTVDGDGATKPAAKPKRKRRSSAQVKADNAAIALGFDSAADQAEQEAKMGEGKDVTEGAATEEESKQLDQELAKEVAEETVSHEAMVDHVERTAELQQPGLPVGTTWNLGGHSFYVAYSDKETVLFKKDGES